MSSTPDIAYQDSALLLGIDVGTTATKAVLVSRSGKLLAEGRSEYRTTFPQPGWAQQAPEDWWNALCASVKEVLGHVDGAGARVIGLSISAQAPTLIAVDRDGLAIYPALIWMDRRAELQSQKLLKMVPHIAEITGNRADPFYVAAKMLWLKENEPEDFQSTFKFLQIPGYLNFHLTGIFGIDRAHATLLQLLDRKTNSWNSDLMLAVGVNPEQLPEIFESTQILGELTERASEVIGLPSGIPVFAGSVDGAMAALEAGVIDPGVVAEMTGTSTVLLMPTHAGTHNCVEGKVPFISMAHAIAGRELLLGAMVSSGGNVRWLHQVILGGRWTLDELMADAETVPVGSGGLIFLPYMMGERAPIWDTYARGVFFGLTLNTSKAAMVRAVLEGTAYALAHNVEVARNAGVEINEIRSVGGGTKNRLWNQIKADVLGIPIVSLKESAGAAMGNAYLVGIGLGIFPDIRKMLSEVIEIQERFLPDAKHHEHYQRRYQRFRSLYEKLKDEFKASAESETFS